MPRRRPPRTALGWLRRPIPRWSVPIIVVAVLLAAEVGARVVGPEIPRRAGTEERLLIKADQIFDRGDGSTDVVFLGASESAGGLVPSVVDEQVDGLDGMYNAALIGASLDITTDWTERVVAPHLRPDVAVIGLLPMTVLDEDLVVGQEGLEQQRAALDSYRAALDQVDPGGWHGVGWELRQRSALVRWRPYLRSPSQLARGVAAVLGHGPDPAPDDGRAIDWLTETDPARLRAATSDDGVVSDYEASSLPVAADQLGAALYTTFGEARTDFTQLAALTDWLQDHDITPVLAIAPADRQVLEAGGADLAPLDAVVAEIQAWAAERSIAVDDQFTATWDPELFHDRNHLDADGAERWSAAVGRRLQELCASGALEVCAPG